MLCEDIDTRFKDTSINSTRNVSLRRDHEESKEPIVDDTTMHDEMEDINTNMVIERHDTLIKHVNISPSVRVILQTSLVLGHISSTPGLLLQAGANFIVRDVRDVQDVRYARGARDFIVNGGEMLRLLTTGKSIKSGGIHIKWSVPNVHIDITGDGVATYIVPIYTIRGFVSMTYPNLCVLCEHDSQTWCYMKNGGILCIRMHKYMDGKDLRF